MEKNDTILDAVDPELMKKLVTRREAIMKGAAAGSTVIAGLAMASAPLAFAALAKEAKAQSSVTVQQVLNFALMLEIFENEFYKAVLGTSSSTAQNSVFATVRPQAAAIAGVLPALTQISKHEASHVAFLLSAGAVNTLNLTATSFDFTGGRGSGTGPFAAAGSDPQFLLLTAQGAEDTGVRAYKGQAGNLMSNSTVLEAALRIHSVEARHASKLRRLRRANGATGIKYSGTISGGGISAAGAGNVANPSAGSVAALTAIYAGEENTTQATVNVTSLNPGTDTNAASEAFDEPLTMAQVIAIVQPFFIPTLS